MVDGSVPRSGRHPKTPARAFKPSSICNVGYKDPSSAFACSQTRPWDANLNFKEVKATSGRVVRGRQVLFMFEQYFRTNEEAGALYGTEGLLKIHLVNNDLATFIRNWDAVIAGLQPTYIGVIV